MLMNEENVIKFSWTRDGDGPLYLKVDEAPAALDGDRLDVWVGDRYYPVCRLAVLKEGEYGDYLARHGCAACSLAMALCAFLPDRFGDLRPDQVVGELEKKHFSGLAWNWNYKKPVSLQRSVSLYGMSLILHAEGVANRYVRNFEDVAAFYEIREHLRSGKPVIVEVSRCRRKNGQIVSLIDRKYAESYHTIVLLGYDRHGRVIFTDTSDRDWSGKYQRLKKARLTELINYMYPQKKTRDSHVYFTKRRKTGGYILIDG